MDTANIDLNQASLRFIILDHQVPHRDLKNTCVRILTGDKSKLSDGNFDFNAN
jgi:hypothetical protein